MRVERLIAGYPLVLNTLGDHLLKRRLDLGLQWRQVAEQIGTDDSCVAYWRTGQTNPGLRLWPRVIRFLRLRPETEASEDRRKAGPAPGVAGSVAEGDGEDAWSRPEHAGEVGEGGASTVLVHCPRSAD